MGTGHLGGRGGRGGVGRGWRHDPVLGAAAARRSTLRWDVGRLLGVGCGRAGLQPRELGGAAHALRPCPGCPAEELLFRGVGQGRLNEAFGQPWRSFGVPWGWGAVGSAALLGLWHVVLSPYSPAVWPHALWTFFVGLFFACLQERSGGLAAPSLLHGVLNYVPFFDLLAG
ncbi:MAG: CPBP family intramembrane metalloprotease [Chloroflexi bacterium]|nr:CPBP family intramembrane metalloprotease [Chloroflexota bacterium]